MHFHLPKPLHGWREFAGEVGIIVVGVLIALAFEAVVDDLSWNAKVNEARTELRHELGHNLALLDDRIAHQHCIERRIAELAPIITRASESGRLPPTGVIYTPGTYTWPTSVRDSQMAAQTITHFPSKESAAISRVYRYISTMQEDSDAEEQAWQTLNGMAGPGRPIDAASISRLVDALNVARWRSASFAPKKKMVETILVQAGLGRDFPQVDPANPPVLDSVKPAICQPIGKPPSTY